MPMSKSGAAKAFSVRRSPRARRRLQISARAVSSRRLDGHFRACPRPVGGCTRPSLRPRSSPRREGDDRDAAAGRPTHRWRPPETTSVRGCCARGRRRRQFVRALSSVTTITFGRSLSGVASWPRCGCAVVHEPVTTRTATLPAAVVALWSPPSHRAGPSARTRQIATSRLEPSVPNARPAHVDHCVSSHAHVAPVLSPGQSRLLALAAGVEHGAADLARAPRARRRPGLPDTSLNRRRWCTRSGRSARRPNGARPETVRSSARPLPTAHTPTSVPSVQGTVGCFVAVGG